MVLSQAGMQQHFLAWAVNSPLEIAKAAHRNKAIPTLTTCTLALANCHHALVLRVLPCEIIKKSEVLVKTRKNKNALSSSGHRAKVSNRYYRGLRSEV